MDVSVRRRAADAALAVLLFAVMVAELAGPPADPGERPATLPAYLLAAAVTLPVALHRAYPAPVVLAVAAAVVAYGVGAWAAFPGWSVFALVFLVGLHAGRRTGALAFGVLTAALAAALALAPSVRGSASTWLTCMLALTCAWLAAGSIATLRDRARRLEAEREDRARQAVTEDRLRIARELHDVVAHAMSVVAVQAGVAHHVIDARPDLAKEAIGTVETSTRAALVEMRRLLGVLRADDQPGAALTPPPGLAAVPALVAQLRDAGLTVRLRVEGEATLPDGVDLSAYRVVQEGLTNALRHGGPAADVLIRHTPGAVELSVTDDGRPGPAPEHEPGHGLAGMRERVAVYGGTLTAGPRPGGGFALAVTLPYGTRVAA
ncbi:sensor histidine kinase [Spirilliplanes yamanashiensis]|uniref:histidine kinase n=1 Tax=Spirilliplanes yamanashiensis TaxID=42233 RepID=A0A8J3Y4Q3_9ACTN|nr:sensor histidine kinase [Spirilliplanes yamanashiensis]MDP9819838.1 signal transduction histidine kinase [Spirilliplanes yamanashiensis]GIJ01343.1 hypothetical protein Sya03_06950 [Spirilliplanes yamanashiensis]